MTTLLRIVMFVVAVTFANAAQMMIDSLGNAKKLPPNAKKLSSNAKKIPSNHKKVSPLMRKGKKKVSSLIHKTAVVTAEGETEKYPPHVIQDCALEEGPDKTWKSIADFDGGKKGKGRNRWCAHLKNTDKETCESHYTWMKCHKTTGKATVYYPCKWHSHTKKKCVAQGMYSCAGGMPKEGAPDGKEDACPDHVGPEPLPEDEDEDEAGGAAPGGEEGGEAGGAAEGGGEEGPAEGGGEEGGPAEGGGEAGGEEAAGEETKHEDEEEPEEDKEADKEDEETEDDAEDDDESEPDEDEEEEAEKEEDKEEEEGGE